MSPLPAPVLWTLAAVTLVAALTDMRSRRIPNWLCATGVVLGFALNAWLYGWAGVGSAGKGFGLALLFYVPLFALRAMGGGDVKLAGVLGLYLGWLGWDVWALGLIGGFLTGGLFGVALLATGKAGRKTKVPYGPFLLAGALLAVFFGDPVTQAWLGV